MKGILEAAKEKHGEVRVFTIFIDEDTKLQGLLDLLPEERKGARHQILMLYAWPATQSKPKTWEGMFNATGIYSILNDAPTRGLKISWPGMDPSLYKLMSSKSYMPIFQGKQDIFNVAPTVVIKREDFFKDPEGTVQWAVKEVGEKVMVKRGNTWGNTGTHPAKGAQAIQDRLKSGFAEEDEAEQIFVQKVFPNVVGEMRSFRVFEGEGNIVGRTVFMCPEDGRSNDEETGAGLTDQYTMTREKAIEKMFFGREDLCDEAVRRLQEIAKKADEFCKEYCGDLPGDYRVDVLVAIKKDEASCELTMDLSLCELTEQGASMCGTDPNARWCGVWQRTFAEQCKDRLTCLCHSRLEWSPTNHLKDRYTGAP